LLDKVANKIMANKTQNQENDRENKTKISEYSTIKRSRRSVSKTSWNTKKLTGKPISSNKKLASRNKSALGKITKTEKMKAFFSHQPTIDAAKHSELRASVVSSKTRNSIIQNRK